MKCAPRARRGQSVDLESHFQAAVVYHRPRLTPLRHVLVGVAATLLLGALPLSAVAAPPSTAPAAPTGLVLSAATATGLTVTWNAETGVSGFGVYLNGTRVGSTTSAEVRYSFAGLSCGSSYTIGVDAVHSSGNRSAVAAVVATTSACSDAQAPSVPSGLGVSGQTSGGFTLAWKASTDNVGVTGYGICLNGSRVGSASAAELTYPFGGLACGTYTVGVDAADAAGNRSAVATVQASPSGCGDPPAPSVRSGLGVSEQTSGGFTLGWKASTDNVGVSGYGIYLNGSRVGSASSAELTYPFGGLACGTYTVGVDAADAAGNRSAVASVQASTAGCGGGAPAGSPAPPTSCSGVAVAPGGSLQGAVNAAGGGTTFCLGSGVYRLSQAVVPKSGDGFVGTAGTVVSGAVALGSFSQSGGSYVASGLSGFNPNHTGACRAGVTMCVYANDVYFDDRPLQRVASLAALLSGKVFVDEGAGRVYLADNPSGHTVELGLARQAFSGGADNVTVQGLTVEKFANEGQVAAVGSRYNWSVVNDEIRFNHGIGVGEAALISGSFIHDNGEMGIAMSFVRPPAGSPFQVLNNEISGNNYAGYDPNWEGGCCKFGVVNGLVVSGNYIHDNLGKGLWSDGDNFNVVLDNNRIINNQYNGINYELSFNAIIRNNDIEGNGFGVAASTPLEGSGIELSNSCCTEIYGNTVKGNRDGIGLVQSNRPPGPNGAYITHDNNIHDNTITLSGTAYNGMIEW